MFSIRKYAGRKKFPWGRAVLWLLLALYLAVVLYATIVRHFGGSRQWNLHLLRAWREAWNNFSAKNWANVLLNVALFIPLGGLLPLLHEKFRKWYRTIPVGLAVSLTIELLQLVFARGICDVDDLLANALGAAIGYFGIMTILALVGEKGKRLRSAICYGCLTLVPVAAMGSVFLVYGLREYGNLPDAPAYRVDLSGVEWQLDCSLPSQQEIAAVYRNQSRSTAECDAFAADFAETVGTVFDDISYYQEAAYYMDHGGGDGYHFLFVNYLDAGYRYSWGNDSEPVWETADREAVEEALGKYPLQIPEYAAFTPEGDGWHSFTVEQSVDGAVMIDGSLRCRYAQDGTVREIENGLLSYRYYGEVDVISPEEAWKQVCRGNFSGADALKHSGAETVCVTDCSLDYAIDTKGFYQPVYRFTLEVSGNGYPYEIMIPAMQA